MINPFDSQMIRIAYKIGFFFLLVQIFDGNKDAGSVSCCELPYPLVVRYIRFKPVSWEKKICLRVGVFGKGNVTGTYF